MSTLFYLDDQAYTQADVSARWQVLSQTPSLAGCRRLAVCTRDVFGWLAVALYCRREGLSVAPLHTDTPLAVARNKAEQLGCDALLWQSANSVERLGAPVGPAGTLIQFSSGTTGEPKPIERHWDEIALEIEHYNHALNLEVDVVPVIACSVSHSYGLISGLLASLARGAVPHIVTGWNPKPLMRTLRVYPRPLLYSSPAFIQALLMLWPEGTPLYGVMTSGSVISEEGFARLKQVATHVWQQYGCSEAGCVTVGYQPEQASVMGQALGHCTLSAGVDAQRPEEVVIRQQGRTIQTGDAGYFDDRSQLRFVGRLDDTIISAGLNVYPLEVEQALMAHPDIHEAVVFKLLDPLAGERVAAVYTGAASLSATALRAHYRQHLAPYQWPVWVRKIECIPRLPSGKISRRQLANQFRSEASVDPARGVA